MTSIQVVTIKKSSLLIKYGLKVILDPFMKDIETLEKVCYNNFVSFMCTSEWGRSNCEWTKKDIMALFYWFLLTILLHITWVAI